MHNASHTHYNYFIIPIWLKKTIPVRTLIDKPLIFPRPTILSVKDVRLSHESAADYIPWLKDPQQNLAILLQLSPIIDEEAFYPR